MSAWGHVPHAQGGVLRLLFGFEPFPSMRSSFSSAQDEFTEEVRRYWLEEHSVSVRLSAKVVRALEALDSDALQVRMLPGRPNLHAKIYVGDEAATVGSSNYTDYGMSQQFEGNARFERAGEPQRFAELSTIAKNYWSRGLDWSDELRLLLMDLLKLVPWQEALARACAELLEKTRMGAHLVAAVAIGCGTPGEREGTAIS